VGSSRSTCQDGTTREYKPEEYFRDPTAGVHGDREFARPDDIPSFIPRVFAIWHDVGGYDGDTEESASGILTGKGRGLEDEKGVERRFERR
jgi:hypothetical protein